MPSALNRFLPHLGRIILTNTAIIISLCVLLFIIALFRFPKNPQITYGVSFDPYYAQSLGLDWKETYRAILDDLKIKHIRLTAHWNVIEPRPGEFFWKDLDWLVQEAAQRDVKVLLAVGRKLPRWPECHDPEWIKTRAPGAQEAPGAFKSFGTDENDKINKLILKQVEKVVKRYRNYENIEAWQVENEPFFKFGLCPLLSFNQVGREIDLVKSLDDRPTFTTDSGEGGMWLPAASLGDRLGISMYRTVWFDFWSIIPAFYFRYPLPHWTYRVKAAFTGVPLKDIWIVELQGEPWGAYTPTQELSLEEEQITMNPEKFEKTIDYSYRSGVDTLYWWGAEWWYFKKLKRGDPFYWERAKKLFR